MSQPPPTACAFFRLALEWRDAGQGDTHSFGADGIWGLLGRPPERAREQCARPQPPDHRSSCLSAEFSHAKSGGTLLNRFDHFWDYVTFSIARHPTEPSKDFPKKAGL